MPGPFFQVDSVDSLCLDKAVVEVSQMSNRITELQVEWGFSDVEGSFLTSVVNLGFCCSTSVCFTVGPAEGECFEVNLEGFCLAQHKPSCLHTDFLQLALGLRDIESLKQDQD